MSNFITRFQLGEKVIWNALVLHVQAVAISSTSEKRIAVYRLSSALPDAYYAGSARTDEIPEAEIRPWSEKAEREIAEAKEVLKRYGMDGV